MLPKEKYHLSEALTNIEAEAGRDNILKGSGEYLEPSLLKIYPMTLLHVLYISNHIFAGEDGGFLPITGVAIFCVETLAQDLQHALQLPGIHKEIVT